MDQLYMTSQVSNITRLSITIGGNREMDQLYMTTQVSTKTRNTIFSPISWHFQDYIRKCKIRKFRKQNRNYFTVR